MPYSKTAAKRADPNVILEFFKDEGGAEEPGFYVRRGRSPGG